MRRAGAFILVCALGLVGLSLAVFGHEPAPGRAHWAAPPLLAFSIVGGMGGLVALATARRGSLK